MWAGHKGTTGVGSSIRLVWGETGTITTLGLQGQGEGGQRDSLEAGWRAETKIREEPDKYPSLTLFPAPPTAEGPHWPNPTGSQRVTEPTYGSIQISRAEKSREWVWRGKQKTANPAVRIPIFRNARLPMEEQQTPGGLRQCRCISVCVRRGGCKVGGEETFLFGLTVCPTPLPPV